MGVCKHRRDAEKDAAGCPRFVFSSHPLHPRPPTTNIKYAIDSKTRPTTYLSHTARGRFPGALPNPKSSSLTQESLTSHTGLPPLPRMQPPSTLFPLNPPLTPPSRSGVVQPVTGRTGYSRRRGGVTWRRYPGSHGRTTSCFFSYLSRVLLVHFIKLRERLHASSFI
jgi:hypothetical protein